MNDSVSGAPRRRNWRAWTWLAIVSAAAWAGFVWAQRARASRSVAGLQIETDRARAAHDWNAAVAILDEAVRETPRDVALRGQLAEARLHSGDLPGFARAAEAWQALVTDTPLALQILHARAEEREGNIMAAIERWDVVLARADIGKPARIDALRAQSQLLLEQQLWPRALRRLTEWIELADGLEPRLLRFDAGLMLRDWSRAGDDCRRAVALAESDERVRDLRPKWERAEEKLPAILAAGQTLAAHPDDMSALVARAMAEADAGLFAHAAQDIATAIEKFPKALRPRFEWRLLERIRCDGHGSIRVGRSHARASMSAPSREEDARRFPLISSPSMQREWDVWHAGADVGRALEQLSLTDATDDDAASIAQTRAGALRALNANALLDEYLRERVRTRRDWNAPLLRLAVESALWRRAPLAAAHWADCVSDDLATRPLRLELQARVAHDRAQFDVAIQSLTQALEIGGPSVGRLLLRAESRRLLFDDTGAAIDRAAAHDLTSSAAARTNEEPIVQLTRLPDLSAMPALAPEASLP